MNELKLDIHGIVTSLQVDSKRLWRSASRRYAPFETRKAPDLWLEVRTFTRWNPSNPPPPPVLVYPLPKAKRIQLVRSGLFLDVDLKRGQGTARIWDRAVELDSVLRGLYSVLLFSNSGFLLHAASILRPRKRCWVIPGRSGTGKTTLALKCRRSRSPDQVLTDEMTAVTADAPPHVSATPFWGGFRRPRISARGSLELLIFPRRSPQLAVHPISPYAAAYRLLQTVVCFSPGMDWGERSLPWCINLARSVPCFELGYEKRIHRWHEIVEKIERAHGLLV